MKGVNWEAIGAFLREARASGSLKKEPPPEPDALPVDMRRVMAYRATVQHVGSRLDPGAHATAAAPGLQDSAPRAALYGLHARMHGVGPDAWEHPSLVQIWFRLGADYVIPRDALDEFTAGTQPDDPAQRNALDALGDMVRDVVAGGPMRTRDIVRRLGDRLPTPHLIRISQVSGKVVIRWDARTTEVIASEDPLIEPAPARAGLARRFVHLYGPVGPAHFARWAAVPKALATDAFAELDLVPVDVEGRGRSILRSDVDLVQESPPHEGVRLLPGGLDPYLYFDHGSPPVVPQVGPTVTQRLVNSLAGRILMDGEVVGAWGRVQEKVTLFGWQKLSSADVDRIDEEARGFSGPLGGREAKVRWLS